MNLIIDIGNSQTKVAVFDAGEILQVMCLKELNIARLEEIKGLYPEINKVILSSVADIDAELLASMVKDFDFFIEFNQHTPVPIENLYLSKDTLGSDRLAAAVGAVSLFPCQDLLVVDAGTAITYDLIDKNNCFLGGNISPGLRTRFRALNKFTRNLPEIEPAAQWPDIGKTTEEAIRAGVQNGVIFEIDGMISQVRKTWPGCQVILTGGDLFFFDKKLKNSIFVKFEITLIGLNRILEYNAEKN